MVDCCGLCYVPLPPPRVRHNPAWPFQRNSLHYGSFSTLDVNSWRLRGKHATPRRRVQDYPRVNLTTRSPKLMETNDDKKPLQCQDSRSHVICLCHQSRAPFFSAFYLYSEALDEKRRARSTQSHKISASRPQQAERGFIACLQIMRTLISPPQNDILGPSWSHKKNPEQ